MSFELFYTSVAKGLRPGSKGFCIVGLTRGTPAALVERLESMSEYRPLFPVGSPRANANPIRWAHSRVTVGTQIFSVLSRVCFAGVDYSQRSNIFAHHIALRAGEQPAAGPAWVMFQQAVMSTTWTGAPAEYDQGPSLPDGLSRATRCDAWDAATGDGGWAGVLAESAGASKPVYIIFAPGLDLLPLMVEAMALVPESRRWQVTFSTYFTGLSAGTTCDWRCCAAGTPAAEEARRSGGVLIDLTGPLDGATGGSLVNFARTGVGDIPSKPHPANASDGLPGLLDQFPDDEGDYAPVPPPTATARQRAPTVRPRFKAATEPEPQPIADPNDWMPPVAATIVESAYLARRPRRPSGPTWAVTTAIAAGVGLLVFVIMLVREHYAVQSPQEHIVAPPPAVQSTANAPIPATPDTTPPPATSPDPEKTRLPKAASQGERNHPILSGIEKAFSGAESAASPRKVTTKSADTHSKDSTKKTPSVEVPTGVPWEQIAQSTHRFIDPAKLPTNAKTTPVDGSAAAIPQGTALKLEVIEIAPVPNAKYALISETNAAGEVVISFSPPSGIAENKFTFATRRSGLTCSWDSVPSPEQQDLLSRYLRGSLLSAGDQSIQFVKPATSELKLRQPGVGLNLPDIQPPASAVVVLITEPPDGWKYTKEPQQSIEFIDPSGTTKFYITFNINAGKLDSTFADVVSKEEKKAADAKAAAITQALNDKKKPEDAIVPPPTSAMNSLQAVDHIGGWLTLKNGVLLSHLTFNGPKNPHG